MAVTLKIEDKSRPSPSKKGPKAGPNATGFNAYALPNEQKYGWIALASWIALMALTCIPWWFFEATKTTFAYGMPVWCVLSSLGVLYYGPSHTASKLKKSGRAAVISSQNQAPIRALISKASKIYGIADPEAFIESPPPPAPIPVPKAPKKEKPKKEPKPEQTDEELGRFKSLLRDASEAASDVLKREEKPQVVIKNLGAANVRAMPGAVLVNKQAFTGLEPNEISALVMRALVDNRQGHARRLFLLDFIDRVEPRTMLYLVWPVTIYAKLLRSMWLPHAIQSTDRLALLLVRNPELMLSAILKDYAAQDANMQELQVGTQDVSNWINQRGHIGGSGAEISTQYKLGRAIHEDPPLEERLQNLQTWAKSNEFKEALEAVKPAR